MTIQIGDSFRVKDGFVDEELGCEMGGWQGRVAELFPDAGTALLSFDSVTIRAMPADYIQQCEEGGYGWEQYGYALSDLETAEPRDTQADVDEAYAEMSSLFHFSHLGEEGRDIEKVLSDVDDLEDDHEVLTAWWEYLEENLTFPFTAEISEYQERGPLKGGDKFKVHKIEALDERYGLLVSMRSGRKVHHFPLCDLSVVDQSSPNHDPVQLYAVWYANR